MYTFSKNRGGVQDFLLNTSDFVWHTWPEEVLKKSTTSVFALSTSSLYIHEHNRGGAWSLSTSSLYLWTQKRRCLKCVMYRNRSYHHHHPTSKLNTSSGLNLCSQQRCLTFLNGQNCLSEHLLWSCMSHKIRGVLKQRCLRFLVEHLCCVHKFKGRRCSTQNLEHLLHFLKMCTLSLGNIMLGVGGVSHGALSNERWGEIWCDEKQRDWNVYPSLKMRFI